MVKQLTVEHGRRSKGAMVLGRTYDAQVCSLARALEIVGERWTLLIVRDALLGLTRFEQFSESLGLARTVLTDRLGRLVEAGVLERVRYQRRPERHEYRLTERGRGLGVPVLALMQWGDAHLAGPAGPPRLARHAGCAGDVSIGATCRHCGQPVHRDLELTPGPGAHPG
ncbi:MAG TPA: helix-turn-helix domain-containing protein [Pseudonocardia sp.]